MQNNGMKRPHDFCVSFGQYLWPVIATRWHFSILSLSVSLHTYFVQVSGELRTFSLATQISERIEKAIEYNVVTDCFNVAETSIIEEVFIG